MLFAGLSGFVAVYVFNHWLTVVKITFIRNRLDNPTIQGRQA
jgi:hypothetical protein